MYVNQNSRKIFIHNPKTGGTSIIKILNFHNHNNKRFIHMTTYDAATIFQNTWNNYYSFGFVRNPWDRMVSLYHYQRSISYGIFTKFNQTHQLASLYGFSDWLSFNISNPTSMWVDKPQFDWLDGLTEVYAFEEFTDAVLRLLELFEISSNNIVHENKSVSHEHYRNFFVRDDHINYIGELDKKVIDQFCYSF